MRWEGGLSFSVLSLVQQCTDSQSVRQKTKNFLCQAMQRQSIAKTIEINMGNLNQENI